MQVNIFGSCGDGDCDEECEEEQMKSHKFYLSFENAICQDYITEKFFRAVERGLVPIVLGQ